MESQIGELAIADSVLVDPGRVQLIASSRGYTAPRGTDQVAVTPAVLPQPPVSVAGAAKAPSAPLAAWASAGVLGR